MQDREPNPSAQQKRWFDDDDLPPAPHRGAPNEWRPAPRPRGAFFHWVLLALLLLLVLAHTFLKDEALPWEDDLKRPPLLTTTPDMSAPHRMKVLLDAAAKVDAAQFAAEPPWQWDTPRLAGVLEKHGPVLDNVRDLLEEDEDEWEPRSPLWMIEDFGDHTGWRAVVVLKQAESAYLARRGQEEPAFLAAMDLAVMAHLLERLDAWPAFMDRSLEMQERCAQSLAELLKQTQLTGPVLRRLQEEEYQPWAPSVEALRKAMGGYYAYERKLLLGPDIGEPPLPPGYLPARSGWVLFKTHATLRLLAESFRELQNESSSTAYARQNQIMPRVNQMRQTGGLLPDTNQSGNDYYISRILPYVGLLDRHSVARAQHAAVMTLFALRRHVLAEARLPENAAALVPKYLSEPQLDPFSGEPLRFNVIRGLIYSVGTDLKDEGGRPTIPPLADATEPTLETGIGLATSAGS